MYSTSTSFPQKEVISFCFLSSFLSADGEVYFDHVDEAKPLENDRGIRQLEPGTTDYAI